jgi:osmotically-inducible protein OsmY
MVLALVVLARALPREETVASAVRRNLRHSEAVAAHLLDVSAKEGIVTLRGTVGNLLARDRALDIAAGIRGVTAVVDELEVKPVDRSDAEIRADVTLAVVLDPATDSYEIDVSVDKGTVTLTGTVDSWAERRLAATVAKGVKGVRELENRIEIEPKEARPDAEVEAEVRRRLKADPFVSEGSVHVSVDSGIVSLSGRVVSLAEKARAGMDARVAGCREVDMEGLNVALRGESTMERETAAVILADSTIAATIRTLLRDDPRTREFDLRVAVESGVVTLEGVVGNLKAKSAARRDAAGVIGVSRVDNRIKVRPEGPHATKEIEANANYVLAWDPVVERHELSVDVRNGKAFLYGAVDSDYERRRAGDIVSRVPGVVEVDNRLVVNPIEWRWKSDEAIAREAQEELRWDWRVDEGDVEVSVDDGVAKLEGEVASRSELHAAVENAFDAGARIVTSRLDLKGMRYFRVYHTRGDVRL